MSSDPADKRVFAAWTQGRRERQEDNCGMEELGANGSQLLVIADGMGGEAAGDVASDMAVGSFMAEAKALSAADPRTRFRKSLKLANERISAHVSANPGLGGMGTTLLAVEVVDDTIRWISVGDSLLYRVRDGKIEQLNENHSMAGLYAELVQKGELTEKEAQARGGHSQLRSALTGDEIKLIDDANVETGIAISAGDTLILATDGLETLTVNEIAKAVAADRGNAKAIAERLIDAVNKANRPKQDNATVIVHVHHGDSADAKPKKRNMLNTDAAIIGAALLGALIIAGLTLYFLNQPSTQLASEQGEDQSAILTNQNQDASTGAARAEASDDLRGRTDDTISTETETLTDFTNENPLDGSPSMNEVSDAPSEDISSTEVDPDAATDTEGGDVSLEDDEVHVDLEEERPD